MSAEVQTTLTWHGQKVMNRGRRVVGLSAYEVGLVVQGHAVELAPVKTGYLRGSIVTQSAGKGTTTRSARDGRRAAGIAGPRDDREVLVGTSVDYGPPVEFGALTRPSQPFLRPALALARGDVLIIVQRNSKLVFAEFLNPRAA